MYATHSSGAISRSDSSAGRPPANRPVKAIPDHAQRVGHPARRSPGAPAIGRRLSRTTSRRRCVSLRAHSTHGDDTSRQPPGPRSTWARRHDTKRPRPPSHSLAQWDRSAHPKHAPRRRSWNPTAEHGTHPEAPASTAVAEPEAPARNARSTRLDGGRGPRRPGTDSAGGAGSASRRRADRLRRPRRWTHGERPTTDDG